MTERQEALAQSVELTNIDLREKLNVLTDRVNTFTESSIRISLAVDQLLNLVHRHEERLNHHEEMLDDLEGS